MKKVMRFACLVGVVALALTSCKKNEQTATSFKAATEQFVVESEDDSRVYVNTNNQIVFEQNDQVMLFNIGGEVDDAALYYSTSTDTYVEFRPVQEVGINPTADAEGAFYAFYPGENVIPANLRSESRYKFPVAAEQEYRTLNGNVAVPKGAMYMAAKEANVKQLGQVNFQFKNICGLACFKFYSSTPGKTIKRIKVEDKTFNISGDVELRVDKVDPDEMTSLLNNYNLSNQSYVDQLNDYIREVGYNVTNSGRSIVLNLGEGVELTTTKATAKQFLMVLRPLALKNGCKIYVSEDSTGENWILAADSNKDNMIRPNLFRNFAAVKINF